MAEDNPHSPDVASSSVSPTSNFTEVEVNPNQRLSSVFLNEFNYLPWSRAVSLALGGRSKLGYVNGIIQAPEISSPLYETWLCKDQLVMYWLLNSMERKLAEIFSYLESSFHLWKNVCEMYGNQNNVARIFQLKRDLAGLQQESKYFVQHLGDIKGIWNELDVYRPHTTDASVLLKSVEEDKIFQLLVSLSSNYEDLRSHILMNNELPSFSSICAIIQREETRRKVMNLETKNSLPESRAYVSNHKFLDEKRDTGRRLDLKCKHCNNGGHTIDKCWILHPELKPNFQKNKGFQRNSQPPLYKANHAALAAHSSSSESLLDFTSNPVNLINEFAVYLQGKQRSGDLENTTGTGIENPIALLSKFAGFLADSDHGGSSNQIPGHLSGHSHQEEDW